MTKSEKQKMTKSDKKWRKSDKKDTFGNHDFSLDNLHCKHVSQACLYRGQDYPLYNHACKSCLTQ